MSKSVLDELGLGKYADVQEDGEPIRNEDPDAPPPEQPAPEPKVAKKKASKKKASKKKASKKKRAKKRAGNDVLAALQDELAAISQEDADKGQVNQLKAELRSTKALLTRLGRFKSRVDAALETASEQAQKLEEQLARLTQSEEDKDDE